ncbi:glutamate ABC transporter substrate-binding protein [Actinomadura roseirufa]|uniref:glutamate ABC transporter substrate-binding protein n=1 Tax=Actinomadura roseirufa TaxID=2094049 RepID=UPI0010419AC3|nr:glutamate ABC transporter substrate-binding protein [Actinomadura roseirufa]
MRGRVPRAALAAAAILAAGACGIADAGERSVVGRHELVIGVNADQPGLASRTASGGYEGFDIDVAKTVARYLKVPAGKVRFKKVTSDTRKDMLQSGAVDLVVASYSITPERKVDVTFAGPYYVAHQDILVRPSEVVRSVHDLKGKRLCRVKGSVSFPRVHDEKGVAAEPADATGYDDCAARLGAGALDAVSTDDLILAGLSARAARDGRALKIVNAPFSDEPYGVGLRKGDVKGCEAVNRAITSMYQGGTARRLLGRWFGGTGLNITTTVPQFEGCD